MTSSFLDRLAPDYTDTIVAEIKKRQPFVFLVIRRNKNKNIVVYEANVKDGIFDKNKPIDVYWLDIDPEYRKPRREQGINHDRVEMNAQELAFAYGVEAKRVNDTEINMTFNAGSQASTSSHPSRIVINSKSAKMITVWQGVAYCVLSAYVIGTTGLPNFVNLKANVKELSFHGINMATKKSVSIVVLKH